MQNDLKWDKCIWEQCKRTEKTECMLLDPLGNFMLTAKSSACFLTLLCPVTIYNVIMVPCLFCSTEKDVEGRYTKWSTLITSVLLRTLRLSVKRSECLMIPTLYVTIGTTTWIKTEYDLLQN